MLDGANVEGLEETVLLGKVNMDDETTLLSQIEKALKDVLGRGQCGKGRGAGLDGLVRVEAVKKSEGESCLWVRDQKHKAVKKKAKNKKGADGKVLTCFTCKSEYHFSQDCPKTEGEEARKEKKRKFKKHDSSSEESESGEDMLLVEEQEYLLAAGEVRAFTWEARGAAALDSCCTASVCGQEWVNMFLLWEEKPG